MVEYKVCNKCNVKKIFPNDFSSGKNSCKGCRNLALKIKRDANRKPKIKKSKEEKLKRIQEWNKNNPEKRKKYIKKYHDSHKEQEKIYYYNNRESIIKKTKLWIKNNKDKVNESTKKRRKNPTIKLRNNISSLVRFSLKNKSSIKKNKSILDVLDYSMNKLKEHLESQFEPWMTWDNWGVYNSKEWDDNNPSTWTWQLDHIVPQSDLPYVSIEEENFKKCWKLDNLRPLNAKQNILDGTQRNRHNKGK